MILLSLLPLLGIANQNSRIDSLLQLVKKNFVGDSITFFSTGSMVIQEFHSMDVPELETLVLISYGNHYAYNLNYTRAEYFLKKADRLAQKMGVDSIILNARISLGTLRFYQKKYKESEKILEHCFEQASKQNDIYNMLNALNSLAILNKHWLRYEKAMKYYHKAIEICENNHKTKLLIVLLGNLGNLKVGLGYSNGAIKDLKKGLRIAKKNKNVHYIQNASYVLSIAYDNLGNADSALFYIHQSLESAQAIDDFRAVSLSLSNIAYYLLKEQEFTTAALFADSALKMVRLKNIDTYRANAYGTLAKVNLQEGNFTAGINYADSAIQTAQIHKQHFEVLRAYDLKSDAYISMGQYEKAYKNELVCKSYNDSIKERKAGKQIAELQVQYELTQKENELLRERHKTAALSMELETKRKDQFLLLLYFAIGLIALISLYILYHNYHSIAIQRQFSHRLLSEIDSERNKIANQLNNILGESLTILKNTIVNIGETHQNKNVLEQMDELIGKTRKLSHYLYPYYLEKIGLNEAILSYLNSIEQEKGVFCFFEEQNKELNLPKEYKKHIFRIIQECTGSALHNNKTSTIYVSIAAYKKGIQLLYKDDGPFLIERSQYMKSGLMTESERITKVLNGNMKIRDNKNAPGIKLIFTFFPNHFQPYFDLTEKVV